MFFVFEPSNGFRYQYCCRIQQWNGNYVGAEKSSYRAIPLFSGYVLYMEYYDPRGIEHIFFIFCKM